MAANLRKSPLFFSRPSTPSSPSMCPSKVSSQLKRRLGESAFSEKKAPFRPSRVCTTPKSQKVLFKSPVSRHPSSSELEKPNVLQVKRVFRTHRNSMPNVPTPAEHSSVIKCAYKTRVGNVCGRPKQNNQDSFLVHPYIQDKKNSYLFGVFDGHGANGHHVSQFVKNSIVNSLETALNSGLSPPRSLSVAIKKVCSSLDSTNINCANSGTTLTMLHICSDSLTLANVGDSRAVLGKKINEEWLAYQLTTDHKPSLPGEKLRILKAKGRVMPCIGPNNEPIGPDRVWLSTEPIPGLAMSRSIGDQIAKSVGVTSDPEITTLKLSVEDKFVVLATDGVWEFLSNADVVALIGGYLDQNKTKMCCARIVELAVSCWNREDDDVDDITLVIIFLKA